MVCGGSLRASAYSRASRHTCLPPSSVAPFAQIVDGVKKGQGAPRLGRNDLRPDDVRSPYRRWSVGEWAGEAQPPTVVLRFAPRTRPVRVLRSPVRPPCSLERLVLLGSMPSRWTSRVPRSSCRVPVRGQPLVDLPEGLRPHAAHPLLGGDAGLDQPTSCRIGGASRRSAGCRPKPEPAHPLDALGHAVGP
jgi:hypothetical protein